MRMWMVDPRLMCRKHLLGEHVECHMFLGAIKKGKNLSGYIEGGLCELHNLQTRHDDLAWEMERRDYNHNSPLKYEAMAPLGHVARVASLHELQQRCPECRARTKKEVAR